MNNTIDRFIPQPAKGQDEPRIFSVVEIACALGISRTGAYSRIDARGLRNEVGLYTLSEVLAVAVPKQNYHITSERRIDALRLAFDKAGIPYQRNGKVPIIDPTLSIDSAEGIEGIEDSGSIAGIALFPQNAKTR